MVLAEGVVSAPIMGLLPAAGLGTRLWPYKGPKELLPELRKRAGVGAGEERAEVEPVPVCYFSLEAMRDAGVRRCVVVVSEAKAEIIRTLGDGHRLSMELAYVVQREPLGLTNVVRAAAPWLGSARVMFALPDTILSPKDALLQMARMKEADVTLGVFPSDEPERLAPVELDPQGGVLKVHDKPEKSPAQNTWGAMLWSSRFTDFCAAWDQKPERSGVLSHAVEDARAQGMSVQACLFEQGRFLDMGTPLGLAQTLQVWREL